MLVNSLLEPMKVIICGGRNSTIKGDHLDILYDLKDIIGEVVTGMSGGIKTDFKGDVFDKDQRQHDLFRYGTNHTLEAIEQTADYDQIRGVDLWAAKWGMDNGKKVNCYPISNYEWSLYGRGAGPRRNRIMAANARGIIAFPGGAGTVNMCRLAEEARLVQLYVQPIVGVTPKIDSAVVQYMETKKAVEDMEKEINLESEANFAMKRPSSVHILTSGKY